MIRILVVDGSGLVRKVLTRERSRQADIDVVGSVGDADGAYEKIAALRPDVVVLDGGLLCADHLAFLEELVARHPAPVVVVSSLAREESESAIRALALGAVEVAAKPGGELSISNAGCELVRAIRAAAAVRRSTLRFHVGTRGGRPSEPRLRVDADGKLIAIGASTGGARAIEILLTALPANAPGIVIVQQMPAPFLPSFIKYLDALAAMQVREACDGDRVSPGVALVAPGGRHIVVRREGERLAIRFVTRQAGDRGVGAPSVDVLFESVAQSAKGSAIGVVLTGTGTDGARGLLAMRRSGAKTFAQDEESCVVYGMPGEAVRLGAAGEVVPLGRLAEAILGAIR